MQHKSLINKLWPRILAGFIAGIIFRLLFDIIIGLNYHYYTLEHYLSYYLLSIGSSILLFQLFHIINKNLDKKYDWQRKTRTRFLLQLFQHTSLALLIILPLRYLLDILVYKQFFYVVKIEVLSVVLVVLTIVVYDLVEFGFYLFSNSRNSLAELERFKKENAEFKFETLMNQVNPHFLFNSLNTLSSLVYEDPDTASKYIRELSRVYRYVLENKQNELVSLKVDLDFIKAYIYLLELRFKDMISFEISINEKHLQKLIAPMTIQMLIENAIKHNVVSKKKYLQIKIATDNDWLIVSNNLQLKPAKEYSSGLGLSNIKSRYAYLIDKEVEIKESETDFQVKIPLIQKNEEY